MNSKNDIGFFTGLSSYKAYSKAQPTHASGWKDAYHQLGPRLLPQLKCGRTPSKPLLHPPPIDGHLDGIVESLRVRLVKNDSPSSEPFRVLVGLEVVTGTSSMSRHETNLSFSHCSDELVPLHTVRSIFDITARKHRFENGERSLRNCHLHPFFFRISIVCSCEIFLSRRLPVLCNATGLDLQLSKFGFQC